MSRKEWGVERTDRWSGEGYWASYSDLMAGILLVFAVAAASSWIEFHRRMVEPTQPLIEWQQLLNRLCQDQTLNTGITRVDCETGSLILSEASLRYARGSTELSDEGRQLLRGVVPLYLSAVQKHLPDLEENLVGIEISGHTDLSGDYGSNSYISRERAGKVLLFLLDAQECLPFRPLLRRKGFASGYADSRSPRDAERPTDPREWPEARRIEIQVHLDQATILRKLKQMLDSLRR